jgi:hypothetical protein
MLERKADDFLVEALFRVEVTGGVLRADFRRQWISFDVALRDRFA